MPVALITGASRGLGRATARALADRGWSLVVDARREADLADAVRGLPHVTAITGDITSAGHRAALAAAVTGFGRLDLLINNASSLGPSPLPPLRGYDVGALRRVYETNVVAPLALIQLVAGPLAQAPAAPSSTSAPTRPSRPTRAGAATARPRPRLTSSPAVLAAEESVWRCYAFDPGDMRTEMHQQAFPGEDISDRPEPESVVPALLRLIDERPPSGRYRAADLADRVRPDHSVTR